MAFARYIDRPDEPLAGIAEWRELGANPAVLVGDPARPSLDRAVPTLGAMADSMVVGDGVFSFAPPIGLTAFASVHVAFHCQRTGREGLSSYSCCPPEHGVPCVSDQ